MIAGSDVTRVNALHAAFLQRLQFLEAVNVMGRQFTVDLDLHCVQSKCLVVGDRYKDRDFRVRRISNRSSRLLSSEAILNTSDLISWTWPSRLRISSPDRSCAPLEATGPQTSSASTNVRMSLNISKVPLCLRIPCASGSNARPRGNTAHRRQCCGIHFLNL